MNAVRCECDLLPAECLCARMREQVPLTCPLTWRVRHAWTSWCEASMKATRCASWSEHRGNGQGCNGAAGPTANELGRYRLLCFLELHAHSIASVMRAIPDVASPRWHRQPVWARPAASLKSDQGNGRDTAKIGGTPCHARP